jgi:hypothetical protein
MRRVFTTLRPTSRGCLFFLSALAMLLAGPSSGRGDIIVHTFQNTSPQSNANDFFLSTDQNMESFVVKNIGTSGVNKGKPNEKISGKPLSGGFPGKEADLAIFVPVSPGQTVAVEISAPRGTKVTDAYFTNKREGQLDTKSLTMAPQIDYLGGNQFQVTLTNVNGQPVNVSSLSITIDDPADPNNLDTYTQGGTALLISPPANPLGIGDQLTYTFQADPSLTVAVSDQVASSSDPSVQYYDLAAAQAVPEPASIICVGIGCVTLLLYGRRRIQRGRR